MWDLDINRYGFTVTGQQPKHGKRGKIREFNKMRQILQFFAKMELGPFRYAKNALLKSTEIFHSENFHFFVILRPRSALGTLQPWPPLAKALLGARTGH